VLPLRQIVVSAKLSLSTGCQVYVGDGVGETGDSQCERSGSRPYRETSRTGVAFILDIDLKLLEQPSVEDESVNSIAGSQRSLSARARSCTMCWPVSFFQRAPQRFILISTKLLQVASTLPVPSAKPSRRRTGIA
jgi:hypothetical protein